MAAISPSTYPPLYCLSASIPSSIADRSRKSNPKQLQLPVKIQSLEGRCSLLLQSCSSFSDLTQIQAQIIRHSLQQNHFLAARLISSCFCLGCYSYASRIFGLLLRPDAFLFNAMIKGFVSAGFHLEALQLYCTMLYNGCIPNSFTLPLVLKACSNLATAEEGRALHGHALKFGHSSDIFAQTSLIDLYGSCQDANSARNLFDRMPERDVAAWNAMLSAYIQSGSIILAEQLFDEMPVKNMNSWTALVGGLLTAGDPTRALMTFQRMQLCGVKPDKMAIVTILSAISHLGCLSSGKWVHEHITKNAIPIDTFLSTALIDMYSKCGSIQDAKSVFNASQSKNTSCYNAMIFGLGVHGLGEEAIRIFEQMRRTNTKIDDVTVIAVLMACSHSGLVDKGLRWFKMMREAYSFEPTNKHYGCVVDMLGRAGRFTEAVEIVDSVEADYVVIGALAAACRVYGNTELADELAGRMLGFDQEEKSGFLMWRASLHCANGEWEEAAKVRRWLRGKGIEKGAGCSWIEVGGKAHSFVAADHTHPRSKQIYYQLDRLYDVMFEQVLGMEECS